MPFSKWLFVHKQVFKKKISLKTINNWLVLVMNVLFTWLFSPSPHSISVKCYVINSCSGPRAMRFFHCKKNNKWYFWKQISFKSPVFPPWKKMYRKNVQRQSSNSEKMRLNQQMWKMCEEFCCYKIWRGFWSNKMLLSISFASKKFPAFIN